MVPGRYFFVTAAPYAINACRKQIGPICPLRLRTQTMCASTRDLQRTPEKRVRAFRFPSFLVLQKWHSDEATCTGKCPLQGRPAEHRFRSNRLVVGDDGAPKSAAVASSKQSTRPLGPHSRRIVVWSYTEAKHRLVGATRSRPAPARAKSRPDVETQPS